MSIVSPQVTKSYNTSKSVQAIINELNLTSYMGVPLKVKDKVIGAITFSSSRKDRIYSKDDLHFAEEVSMRVANAIENARNFAQLQRSLEAEERLVAIVAFSSDAIISKTLDDIITSWNKAAENIFGYTKEEAIGKSITIIVPKYLWNEEKEIIRKIKKGQDIDHYETIRLRKDGQLIIVSVSISLIKDGKGKIIGVSNITRDITEKKKAENELAHLASLVESSSDAIWSRTLDHKILSWNKGAEEMYGYSADEIVGKNIIDLVVPLEKREELEEIAGKIIQGK